MVWQSYCKNKMVRFFLVHSLHCLLLSKCTFILYCAIWSYDHKIPYSITTTTTTNTNDKNNPTVNIFEICVLNHLHYKRKQPKVKILYYYYTQSTWVLMLPLGIHPSAAGSAVSVSAAFQWSVETSGTFQWQTAPSPPSNCYYHQLH